MSAVIDSSIGTRRSSLEELEDKALQLIRERGDEGIYQHELWKMLGLDSREGSRLALRLLKKGLIIREPTVHNGRRTYKLFLAKQIKKKPKITIRIGNAIEIPCFTCRNLDKCHNGGFYDPSTCPILASWLNNKIRTIKQLMAE